MFDLIIQLHEALKLPPMNEMGVWELALSGGWYMAVNGGAETVSVTPTGGATSDVERFCVVFWFNGWPAGVVDIAHGGFLAAGEAANEQTLRAALEQKLAEAT